MKNVIEILKQFMFIIMLFFKDLFLSLWEPFLTRLLKILIMAAIIYTIVLIIPHGLLWLNEISYLGWLVIYSVYSLLNVKLDDNIDVNFDNTNETTETEQNLETSEPEIKEIKTVNYTDVPPNIAKKDIKNGSTRE